MTRGTLMVAAGVVLGAGGLIAARHDEKHEAVRPLAVREIAEKLDGKETNATAVEVTLEPGQAGASHRHPGPAFGYVLEGEYEWADRRPAGQGAQGGRDVLRAGRVPAPGVQEPGQGEDADAGVGPAPAGREGPRHPGAEEVTPVSDRVRTP